MIQIAGDIDSTDSRKVPIPARYKRIFVEVAADREIDIAVVDDAQLKAFEASDTGDDVEIDWIPYVRAHEGEFDLPAGNGKRYLLLWNANADDEATIAYKITPME